MTPPPVHKHKTCNDQDLGFIFTRLLLHFFVDRVFCLNIFFWFRNFLCLVSMPYYDTVSNNSSEQEMCCCSPEND